MIKKELNDYSGDYEGTEARKLYSDRSDRKRTHKIVGVNVGMIGQCPSKSIRSIANDKTFLSGRLCMKTFGISHTIFIASQEG